MLRVASDFLARKFARGLFFWGVCLGLSCFYQATVLAQSVILTWSPSKAGSVVGYKIYSGTVSRNYTNVIDVGSVTNTTIYGLSTNTTYYFAATAYDSTGNESAFSAEASYAVPAISPGNSLVMPAINPLPNLTIDKNAPSQNVSLSGITLSGSSLNVVAPGITLGATKNTPLLTINAQSSNTGIIPTPVVNYVSPESSGTLTFQSVSNAVGTATITVVLNNGQSSNNIRTESFTVTVLPISSRLAYPPAAAALLPSVKTAGQFSFQVIGLQNSNYVVQASSDLKNWVSLQTNVSPFTFTDSKVASFTNRFYRAYQLP